LASTSTTRAPRAVRWTILFGNTDGDKSAEFAIVLFDVKGIDPSDVMFG
jgi:hypothetical protein